MYVFKIDFRVSLINKRILVVALSTQAGYSRASGVNLLASGYNNPQEKNGGSGIFFANGTFGQVYISSVQASKLIVSDVPIISKRTPPNKCAEQQVPICKVFVAIAAFNNGHCSLP